MFKTFLLPLLALLLACSPVLAEESATTEKAATVISLPVVGKLFGLKPDEVAKENKMLRRAPMPSDRAEKIRQRVREKVRGQRADVPGEIVAYIPPLGSPTLATLFEKDGVIRGVEVVWERQSNRDAKEVHDAIEALREKRPGKAYRTFKVGDTTVHYFFQREIGSLSNPKGIQYKENGATRVLFWIE